MAHRAALGSVPRGADSPCTGSRSPESEVTHPEPQSMLAAPGPPRTGQTRLRVGPRTQSPCSSQPCDANCSRAGSHPKAGACNLPGSFQKDHRNFRMTRLCHTSDRCSPRCKKQVWPSSGLCLPCTLHMPENQGRPTLSLQAQGLAMTDPRVPQTQGTCGDGGDACGCHNWGCPWHNVGGARGKHPIMLRMP